MHNRRIASKTDKPNGRAGDSAATQRKPTKASHYDPPPRVVVADDSKATRKVLKLVLAELGFQVIAEATNGQEAIDLFREHQPDLLLLDINMPLVTGDEALEQVMAENPDAIVIMMTSVADAGSVEKCLTLGAENYIRKDTPLPELRAYLRQTWEAVAFEDDPY